MRRLNRQSLERQAREDFHEHSYGEKYPVLPTNKEMQADIVEHQSPTLGEVGETTLGSSAVIDRRVSMEELTQLHMTSQLPGNHRDIVGNFSPQDLLDTGEVGFAAYSEQHHTVHETRLNGEAPQGYGITSQ